MEDWVQYLIGIFGGGGLATIINTLIARRKSQGEVDMIEAEIKKKDAETTEIITNAATAAANILSVQIKNLQAENETMRCEIKTLQDENTALKRIQDQHSKKIVDLQMIAEQYDLVLDGAHVLYGQVVELNGQPKYRPPERRKREKT